MIHHHRTEVIVLYRRNYHEADRFITFFSQKSGKITILAKGIRRITSKLGGKMELFNWDEIEYEERTSGMKILTTAESRNAFLECKKHPERIEALIEWNRNYLKILPEEAPLPEIFNTYRDLLLLWNQPTLRFIPAFYTSILFLKLCTALHEIQPLTHCFACETKLSPSDQHVFEAMHGAMCCQNCRSKALTSALSHNIFSVSFDILKVLAFVQRSSFAEIERLDLPEHHHQTLASFFRLVQEAFPR